MAKRPSGGDLHHTVAFDKRATANPDSPIDLGSVETDWAEQFQCRAAFIHLRGGEQVLASRLEGKHTLVMRVRSSSSTRSIGMDWRVRDMATGDAFNVRDITPTEADRQWLDVLCESGVAQ
jgi:head-tail adaptor